MPIGRGRHSDIQNASVPEIGNCNATAVHQQIRPGGPADLRKRAVTIAPQMAVSLPPMPRRPAEMFWIEKYSGFVILLPADHVIEEVELNLCAAVVIYPPVGSVNILPAVI